MPEIETTVGGLRAVELNYRPIRDIATGRSVCFISRTQLNTPELGTLMPETFRPAAETSGLSHKLFPLEILQLAEAMRDLNEANRVYDWISVDMPLLILKNRAMVSVLGKICEHFSLTPNKFCFSIPETVLSEDDNKTVENVARLRRHGYHVMLSGFGESGCPFIKLSEFSVDYVMLSAALTNHLGKSERTDQAVHSIITFVNDLGCEPVAEGVKTSSQANSLYGFGCNYAAGSLSGDYKTIADMLE